MINNYNFLNASRDTWLKNGTVDTVGSPPTSGSKSTNLSWFMRFMLFICLLFTGTGIFAQVGVTASLGTTTGSYTTVNAAFAAINLGTHKGVIVITVSGSTTEPATSVPLLASTGTSSYTSIKITASGNATINSATVPTASKGVIELSGADNVTIDGDDPLTSGTQNLSFVVATNTTTGTAAIRLSSNSTTGTDGANNNTVKNCIIIGGRSSATSTTVSYGIIMSNSSGITTGAYSSINTIINNNIITRCYHGVYAAGTSATYPNTGTQITNNVIGSATSANNIGSRGIFINYSAASSGGALINKNDIRVGDYGTTGYSASIAGIEIGTVNYGFVITNNNIHDINQPSSSGYGAHGILVSGSANNTTSTIANNFIRDCKMYVYQAAVLSTFTPNGIYFSAGATGVKLIHNTIVMNTQIGGGTNYSSTCVATAATVVFSQILNNIFVNNATSTASYGIYAGATGVVSAATMNNNDYYVPGGNVGFYSANQTALSNWQTATAKDANSKSVSPTFTSTTDLHIPAGTSTVLESSGATVGTTAISTDYDGDARPGPTGSVNGGGSAPDMGADEFDGVPSLCPQTPSGLVASAITTTTATVSWSAASPVAGNGYEFYYSTSNTSPTGSTTPSGSVGAGILTTNISGLTANGAYYFWVRSNCDGTNKSTWTGPLSFTTPCAASSVPYSEGFESITVAGTLPSCVTSSPAPSTAGKLRTYIATTGSAYLTARTGTKFATVYYSPNAKGTVFSAPLQLTGGVSYTASVYYITDGVAWPTAGIYYGTTATEAGMTNTIASVTSPAATTYTLISGAFTPATSGVYYIGIQADNTSSNAPNYLTFDDFSVVLTPTCFVPTALVASAVTSSTATVTWTAPVSGSPATYVYEVRTSGAAGSGSTGLFTSGSTTAPTVTTSLTGLTAQTSYSVYVRTFCGGSDYSSWTSATTFTTACNAISTFPFVESFDATSTTLGCWGVSAGTGATAQWGVTTSDTTHGVAGPASSTRFAFLDVYNALTTYNSYNIFTPTFTLDATPKRFKYNYYLGTGGYKGTTGTTGTDPYPLQILISVDGGSYTSIYGHTSTNSTFATTTATTEWKSNTLNLTAYAGHTVKLAFVSISNYGSGFCNQAIDQVTIENTPPAITSFAPTAICDGANTNVVITGTAMAGTSAVSVNGTAATSFTIDSPTQITAVFPAGATTGAISVTNPVGSATSSSSLTVNAFPTVGTITGGNEICIGTTLALSSSTLSGTWTSSNTSVATVNASGIVTGLSAGTTTISYAITNLGCTTTNTQVVTVHAPVVITSSTPAQTVVTGDNTTFNVVATGSGLTYQWQVDAGSGFANVVDDAITTGSNTSVLTLTAVPGSYDQYLYQCIVSGVGSCASSTSSVATLTVGNTGIGTNPSPQSICDSGSGAATFTVVATGSVVSYSWEEDQGGDNWTTIVVGGIYSGASTPTLSLSGLVLANTGWRYRCVVTGTANVVTSNPALLTVVQSVTVTNPSTTSVCYSGGTASFSAVATGGVSNYQWEYSNDGVNWGNVSNTTPVGATYSGSTTNTLGVTTTGLTPAAGTYLYRLTVNAAAPCASASSASAQLNINAPTITGQPTAASTLAGSVVTFTSTTSDASPTYQWQYATTVGGTYANVVDNTPSGVTYSGATSGTLTANVAGSASASAANFYRLVVNPTGCSITSNGAQLTVTNYCVPATTTGGTSDSVTNVVVSNVSQSTSFTQASSAASPWYTIYNNTPLNVTQLENMSVAMTFGADGSQHSAIWVDFNHNGVFEASENVALSTAAAAGNATVTYTFSIPLSATPGITRIRLRGASDGAYTAAGACTSSSYGETEDYFLNVLAAPVCSGTPVAGTITSSAANVCYSGSVTLSASGFTSGVIGTSFQWYNSAGAISGAISSTYVTPVLTAPETYFMRVSCSYSSAYADTTPITIGITAPSVTTTTPGNRCGTGTVNLSATSSDTLTWYDAAGSVLYTGANFTTPSISATTTYYVNAGGASFNLGQATDLSANLSSLGAYGMYFSTSTNASTINSVDIYPSTAGTLNVTLKNTSGTLVDTRTFTIAAGDISNTVKKTLALNFAIPANSTGWTINYDLAIYRGAGTYTYPVTNGGFTITGNTLNGNNITSGTRYYFYNWSVTTGCASPKLAVVATVTTPPTLSISGATSSICSGLSTTTPLTITSTVGDFDTYSWTPSTGVTGDSTSGYTFNPTATTTYTLNASNAAGCANTATYTVTVNALPNSFTVSPANTTICSVDAPVLLSVAPINAAPTGGCTDSSVNGQYPSSAYTPLTCNGTTANSITTVGYAGEYSVVNVNSNTVYTFKSSNTADIITVTDSGLTVLANGVGQVSWFSSTSGSVNFYTHNVGCGSDSVSRTRSVICSPVSSVVFSPSAGLFTDAAGTVSYTGTAVTNVYAKPSTTATFTATATNASGCIRTATATINVTPATTWYADADGDTYGNASVSQLSCTQPVGYVANSTDCNDSNALVHDSFSFYVDADHDTYGTGSLVSGICAVDASTPPLGYSVNNTDCNDADATHNPTNPCSSIVNVKLFVEGYYAGAGSMASVRNNQDGVSPTTEVENITVELHDADTYALVATTTAMLNTDGTAVCTFGTAPSGSFFIAVKTSNAIQTWSAAPVSVGAVPQSYDFSTAATQAYGSNMVDLGSGVFGFYSGDINQDELIDYTDYSQWELDYNNFSFGVFVTDLNGDGLVDYSDYSVWELNYNNFIFASYPF